MKLKVAHILNAVGGVETYFRHIVDYIDNDKFQSIVICNKEYDNLDNNNKGIKVYNTTIERDINILKDYNALIETIKILKKENPHIIHCHSSKGGVIGRIAGKILQIPTFYTPNAFSFLSSDSAYKKSLYKKIERFLFFNTSKLLACSNSEYDRGFIDLNLPREKLLNWDNSIPDERQIAKKLKLEDELPEKFICFVGRPSYQKNIESLLNVITNIRKHEPDVHLILMGIGHYSPNLNSIEKRIKEERIGTNITLTPWTDRKTILKIISKSICYISTARYEGLPYSVIESLSLGIPCIVTKVDGNKDLIQDGFNGFVLDEGDETGMAEAVIQLIENEEKRRTLSNHARISYEEKYNLSSNILKLEKLYEDHTRK